MLTRLFTLVSLADKQRQRLKLDINIENWVETKKWDFYLWLL